VTSASEDNSELRLGGVINSLNVVGREFIIRGCSASCRIYGPALVQLAFHQ